MAAKCNTFDCKGDEARTAQRESLLVADASGSLKTSQRDSLTGNWVNTVASKKRGSERGSSVPARLWTLARFLTLC